MSRFWVSWWTPAKDVYRLKSAPFTCWCTGGRGEGTDEECSYCAVVDGNDEQEVTKYVAECVPVSGHRFTDVKALDFLPGGRFVNNRTIRIGNTRGPVIVIEDIREKLLTETHSAAVIEGAKALAQLECRQDDIKQLLAQDPEYVAKVGDIGDIRLLLACAAYVAGTLEVATGARLLEERRSIPFRSADKQP